MYWFTLYGKSNIDAAKRFIGYTDADKRAFDYPQYFILPDKRRKVITHNRVIGEVCIGVEYVRGDESEEITGAELHVTVTCYMVQNVGALLDVPPRVKFDFYKIVRDSGLWSNVDMSRVFVDDGRLVWLYPAAYDKFCEEYAKGNESLFASDVEHYKKRREIEKQAISAGVLVVHCFY